MKNFNPAKKLKSAVQNNGGLLYVTLGFASNTILGGIFWFYIASLIEVSEYGYISYLIAGSQIMTTVGVFGLGISMTSYVAKGIKDIVPQIKSLILISAFLCALVSHLLFGSLSLDFVVMGTMFYTVATSQLLGMKRYKEFGILNMIQKLAQIGISLLLLDSLGVEAILVAYAASYLATSYRFFSSFRHLTLRFGILIEKRQFILSSFGQEIIKVASLSLDKIFIGLFFGYVVLGMYTLGIQLLLVLATIPNIMFAYLLPHDSAGSTQKTIGIIGIGISIILAFAMAIIGPIVLPSFFPSFNDTQVIIQIISFAIIPMTISAILSSRMLGREKGTFIIISASALMASQFILLFVLGNLFLSFGIALAILLSFCIEAALQFGLYKKLVDKNDKIHASSA